MRFSAKSLNALYTKAPFGLPKYPITYHPQVRDALQAGHPVVALETALVTHGEAIERSHIRTTQLEGM
jgi:pseudouridine-5'-phosphate glycosidase